MSGVNGNWGSPPARQPFGSYGSYNADNSSTAYGSGQQEAHVKWLFPLTRSWAVGFVVFAAAGWLLGMAVSGVFDARLNSFGWRVALVYLPNVVSVLLAVLLSGRVHREPHRDSLPRHLVATAAVPLLAFALTIVNGWGVLTLEVTAMTGATVLLGTVCGLVLDRLLEDRRY